MKRIIYCCILLSLPLNQVFAFFCPTNFSQIDVGYTKQQIDEICGKPDGTSDYEQQPEDNTPQEWSYFIKQNPLLGNAIPGTIKATIAFDDKGTVLNMTINGLSVSDANFCSGVIKIGSKREEVRQKCGQPVYVNKSASINNQPVVPKKMTSYQYNTNPPVTLIFENGILVEKK